jgi:serine/threonine protein kinase
MSLVVSCVCGALFNKPSAKFCTKCGLKRPPAPPVGEGTNSSSSSSNESAKNLSTTAAPSPPSSVHATVAPSSVSASPQLMGMEEAALLANSAMMTLGPDGLTPDMLQTPNWAELQQWRKGSLLGRGTYGSVYVALLPDGGFCAVKSVELGKKSGVFSAQELVSLSREIAMMRRLQHPNICSFKGVQYQSEECTVNIFMEYVSGGSLSSVVKKFKPLPPAVVRSWTKQVLEGLCFLHGQGVIHRDVKGDNILVDMSAPPGSGAQIKLADFGAAKRLTDTVGQSRTIIGTPYWMAPEIVDMTGEGNGYSYKADVWSAGCTVAEMITGKPPWPQRPNAPAALFMIANAQGPPTEMPTAVDGASAGCLDFLLKCFTRNPDERPTVEELLQHPWITGTNE